MLNLLYGITFNVITIKYIQYNFTEILLRLQYVQRSIECK